MDINIPWLEVSFHQQLILLHVSTAQDHVVLTGDEPAARAWALEVSVKEDGTLCTRRHLDELSWGIREFQRWLQDRAIKNYVPVEPLKPIGLPQLLHGLG